MFHGMRLIDKSQKILNIYTHFHICRNRDDTFWIQNLNQLESIH